MASAILSEASRVWIGNVRTCPKSWTGEVDLVGPSWWDSPDIGQGLDPYQRWWLASRSSLQYDGIVLCSKYRRIRASVPQGYGS